MDEEDVISVKTEESDIFSIAGQKKKLAKKQFDIIGKLSRENWKTQG